jgi:hypothetical protein
LTQDERVELAIVLSGARRDLGQPEAAVVLLEGPARRARPDRPWTPRLWYALADALLEVGRNSDARSWFAAAAEVDQTGGTDAAERLLELDGIVLEDLQEDAVPDDHAPGGGAPGGGAPEDRAPEDRAPRAPEDGAPEDGAPQAGAPGGGSRHGSAPDAPARDDSGAAGRARSVIEDGAPPASDEGRAAR